MTATTSKNTALVPIDVARIYEQLNYTGLGCDNPLMIGPEHEFFACMPKKGILHPIKTEDADALKNQFHAMNGKELCQEMISSHFELNFEPVADMRTLKENISIHISEIKNLYRLMDEKGFRIIPSSHPPHINGLRDIENQLSNRERIRNVIYPEGKRLLGESFIKWVNLCSGIHISSGYKNTEDFYGQLRRACYLSPFIHAVSNNGFPLWLGMKPHNGVIPRLAVISEFARTATGRTGIDPLFYRTANGKDFLEQYIRRIITAPLLGYYDNKGELNPVSRLQSGCAVSFSDLEGPGLNTLSNYQLAASFWWYDTKIQDTPQKMENNGFAKRLEDRKWNAGSWQFTTALIMNALMMFEPDCAEEIDTLLETFGFHKSGPALSPQSGENLRSTMETAWRQGGRQGLDFRYGNGRALEFSRRFTAILKKYAIKHRLEDYLEPLEYIARTNNTDARILAKICETPEDIVNFVENYDTDALTDACRCFGMLLDESRLPNPAATRKRGARTGRSYDYA